ncbi:MAG: acyltransferase [Acidobacteriota bacterium]
MNWDLEKGPVVKRHAPLRPTAAVETGPRWKRLDGVDLLRGLAILFVLMNHVNMRLLGAKVPYVQGWRPQIVSSLVWNGQMGVQIFFAVSGFLIASTALRRWGSLERVSLKEFYQLRFARIAPLLLLLLAVLCGLHLGGVQHYVVSAKTGGLERALVAALTFHVNWLEATRGYLPANWDILWSLSVEEMFYLGFPLVCWMTRKRWVLVAVLCVFVVLGPWARATAFNEVWYEYSYLGGMDAIALGVLTALWVGSGKLSRAVAWGVGFAGLLLMAFCLGMSRTAYAWGLGKDGLLMSVLGVGTCLVIAAFAAREWKAPGLLWPMLSLGRRSYEIYLTHVFVVWGIFDYFVSQGKPIDLVWWMFGAVIVAAGAAGELVAREVTEPANKWLRKMFGDDGLGSVVEG